MVVPRKKVHFHTSETPKKMHFCILSDIFAPRLLRDRHKSVKTLQNVHFCPDLSIRDATTRNSECTLDPGPSDQNPESPNALNEGHSPSAQTGKGPKRHDSAPSAVNDAKSTFLIKARLCFACAFHILQCFNFWILQ